MSDVRKYMEMVMVLLMVTNKADCILAKKVFKAKALIRLNLLSIQSQRLFLLS